MVLYPKQGDALKLRELGNTGAYFFATFGTDSDATALQAFVIDLSDATKVYSPGYQNLDRKSGFWYFGFDTIPLVKRKSALLLIVQRLRPTVSPVLAVEFTVANATVPARRAALRPLSPLNPPSITYPPSATTNLPSTFTAFGVVGADPVNAPTLKDTGAYSQTGVGVPNPPPGGWTYKFTNVPANIAANPYTLTITDTGGGSTSSTGLVVPPGS
jgi:hypothetical protein